MESFDQTERTTDSQKSNCLCNWASKREHSKTWSPGIRRQRRKWEDAWTQKSANWESCVVPVRGLYPNANTCGKCVLPRGQPEPVGHFISCVKRKKYWRPRCYPWGTSELRNWKVGTITAFNEMLPFRHTKYDSRVMSSTTVPSSCWNNARCLWS